MKNPPKVLFSRFGAMGDVLMITPMIQRFYQSRAGQCEIHVETHYPEIFKNNPWVKFARRPSESFGEKYDITFNLNETYELNNDMHIMDAYELHVFGNTTNHRQCHLFSDNAELASVLTRISLDQKHIVLHMRNIHNHLLNQQARNVDEAIWRQVIDGLLTQTELQVIQVGSHSDLCFTGSDRLIDLRNQLSLHQLMQLMAITGRFVGVDSGPAHIAACTGADMLVLYTTAKSALRRPERPTGKFIGMEANIECQGCLHRMAPGATDVICSRGDAACRLSFDPMTIVQTIKSFA